MAGGSSSIETQRIHGLDWLRVVCMIAVVAIHTLSTCSGLRVLRAQLDFAVPCFLMMSLVLLLPRWESLGRSEMGRFVGLRLLRLLYPYAVWSLVFVVLRVLFGGLQASFGMMVGVVFLGGAAMHLYFIPLLALFTVAFCLIPKSRAVGTAVCLVGAAGAGWLRAVPVSPLPFGSAEARAFPHYLLFELPFLFCAVVIGRWYQRRRKGGREAGWTSPLAFWLCAGLGRYAAWRVGNEVLSSLLFVVAVALFLCGFLVVRQAFPRRLAVVVKVSLGVYYVHPVFVAGARWLERELNLDSGTAAVTVARFGAVLVLSVVTCIFVRRFPRLSPVVS